MIVLNATWLETFTTLCEIGHFTRTAERLGMTQPGVSQHLRKLEAQVGKPLILKDGKSFSLTHAGDAVLSVGQARRAEESDLQQRVQVDDPDVGNVRIGCSGSFALWIYPHLLDRMQIAPELVIRLTAAPQTSILDGVLSGDLDLGVVARQADHPRLHSTPLGKEELCLVLPASYRTGDVTLDGLNKLGFIDHPDGFAYADDLLSRNFPKEYTGADQLKVRTFVNQIGQIPVPVARGLGFTILPKSGVDAFARQQDISILDLQERRYHELWLISRRGGAQFARIAAVQRLVESTTLSDVAKR